MTSPSLVRRTFDAAHAFLSERGVVFDGPPRLSEKFNVYATFFGGIENYRFELQEFRDPAWPRP